MTKLGSENQTKTPSIDLVFARMGLLKDESALFWKEGEISYSEFMSLIENWQNRLREDGVGFGSICAFLGDFSPQSCALMFALIKLKSISFC